MPNSLTDWLRLESERRVRRSLRTNLLAWATEVLAEAGHAPAAHHRRLVDELDQLAHGRIDRLMVLMPPGSAKSTYGSVLFPPWWFTQHPASSIIAVSHTQALAESFSRRVRGLIQSRDAQLGYSLLREERASAHWRISTGGEYVATGVRGGIAGRRADLILIDDPIKSQADAESAGHRHHVWDWYRSDLITRLKPDGRVVLIMTRWHAEDLGGRLLEQAPQEWRVLRLPALAETDDPLGRAVGEPLWPDWENAEALARKRSLVGERVWASLFQQAPRPPGGGLFKADCLLIQDLPPAAGGQSVRAWDLAATAATPGRDPDWTVGVKLHRDPQQRYTVMDVVRMRGTPREVEDAILATARIDGTTVVIGLPEDPGQAGKSQIAYLAGRLAGFRLLTSRETGAKATRALPLASQVEAGNVSLVRAGWNHALLEEMREFPYGRKDDQVDALVRAFLTLMRLSEPSRRVNLPLLGR